ncbi:MAG: helix-turn-helix domain-containing protein [Paludibacter sp.]|jgi:AraC-like DNA-binding protein/outer membrane protein assembly factor BamB
MLYAHVFIIFVFAIMKKYHYSSIQRTLIAFFVCSLTTVLAAGQSVLVRTLHYTTREGMASNVVNTIIQDRQGYLWLGTNLGLTRFDGYRFVNFYHENGGTRRMENVTGIVEDTVQNRLLVCGTDYYLYPFDLESMQLLEADTTVASLFYELKPAYVDEPAIVRRAWERGVRCKNPTRRHNAVSYVTLADGNEIWTTIDNGFYVYDAHTNLINHFTSVDSRPVIESDLMSDVLLDRSGVVWMTNSATGLYQLQFADGDIRYHRLADSSQSESAHSVRSFSEQPDGRLLISNMDGDIYRYNLESCSRELLMHKEHRVYATLTDSRGRLWVATRGGGVWVGDRHLTTAEGFTANIIFHFFCDVNGTVWISTLDKGLVVADEESDGNFRFRTYLDEEKVHQVDADPQGRLWVATESGVFVGENGTFRRVYDGTKVVSICCTADERVLAATIGNGLLIIENNEQTFVTTAEGLANDCVKAVAWDEHIGIVAATDAGITIIAPDGETRSIYSPEGMMADIYNESAALRLSDGRILLGSFNGFVEIERPTPQPLPVREGSSYLSPAIITSIAINGVLRYVQHFTTLTLPHDQNNLYITFSCLDYKNQPSTIFSYRLDGLDSDWQPSTKETTALYNNLSPGHYRFRLRAARAGQAWNKETVLDIRIRQPWWWTWWTRSIYLIGIILFIWYEWRHYSERQRLRRQLDQRLTALYARNAISFSSIPAEVTPEDETISVIEAESAEKTISKTKVDNATKVADRAFLDKLDSIILSSLLQEDLDMAFLADKMCMSHSTLYRRIKLLTGMTASEYVRKHRLAKAMQLLRVGMTPTEVSIQCGFNSPSYFTRCFKSEYGILPSEV